MSWRVCALSLLLCVPVLASAQDTVAPRGLSDEQQQAYAACMATEGDAADADQLCRTQATAEAAKPTEGDAAPDTATTPSRAPDTAADAIVAAEESSNDVAAADSGAQQDAASGAVTPTQAELDYAALYGDPSQDPYDPVFDPTLPTPAELPASYDPWEKMNRRVHRFNNAVDRTVAKPLAKAYVAVVPRPVRLGVGNFFNNLGQPLSMVNGLLQGKPKQAGQSFARFAVNSTLGLAGVFDPATRFNIPNRSEDFGQTLGVWGWKKSRYVELPLFGPRTVRDVFGLVADGRLAPLQYIEEDKARVFLQGLQLVDTRTQLMALDSLREGAADEYALFRDGWMQRRNYQINEGSREDRDASQQLPEYLRDDVDNPTVPVDVMPYVPGSPGG
jgi:phospholipid-binding lipoprotein MlaA